MDVRQVKTYCLMLDKEEASKIDRCLGYCNLKLSETGVGTAYELSQAGIKVADITYFRSKMKEILEVL